MSGGLRKPHKVRKMRHVRPRYPFPCAGGCGRTARRMVRVRETSSDGATRTVRTLMVPYCKSCTPREAS